MGKSWNKDGTDTKLVVIIHGYNNFSLSAVKRTHWNNLKINFSVKFLFTSNLSVHDYIFHVLNTTQRILLSFSKAWPATGKVDSFLGNRVSPWLNRIDGTLAKIIRQCITLKLEETHLLSVKNLSTGLFSFHSRFSQSSLKQKKNHFIDTLNVSSWLDGTPSKAVLMLIRQLRAAKDQTKSCRGLSGTNKFRNRPQEASVVYSRC